MTFVKVLNGVETNVRIPYATRELELPEQPERKFTRNAAITAFDMPQSIGGIPAFTYVMSGLPAGLTFNTSNREVSGTPTAVGDVNATYRVTDGSGASVARTAAFKIVIPGFRYVLDIGQANAVNPTRILNLGVENDVDATVLQMSTWSGNRDIVIAQPASLADITSIVFQGLGDSISAFTKGSTTVTVNGVAYEFWRTNDLQGDVISGRTITVG